VYVTEAFAAALMLESSPYACDYVGHVPAAKDFGRLRMYRLRRGSSAKPRPGQCDDHGGPTLLGGRTPI
jgi:hypothetical protein